MKKLLLLLLLLPSPALAQPHPCDSDTKRAAFHTLNLADKLASTNQREGNPVLKAVFGKRLTPEEAAAAFLFSSLSYELGHRSAVRSGRCDNITRFQNLTLALQAGITSWTLGVRFVF